MDNHVHKKSDIEIFDELSMTYDTKAAIKVNFEFEFEFELKMKKERKKTI